MPATLELPSLADTLRRLRLPAVLAAVAIALALLLGGPAATFLDALERVVRAEPGWALAAAGFEVLSFAGYIALLHHVAGGGRFGLMESYRTTLAGAAASRVLPTAGAGGAALTLWVLKQAGRDAARTLLTFLVLLYAVFLVAILAAGLAAADRGALALVPAALAGGALLIAAVLTVRPVGRTRALSAAIRDAGTLLRRPRPALLGAPAWWAFDCAVLWAAFHAVGAPPATGVLVLGYFLGQVANTVPLPGAASTGMIGVFVAFGVGADLALAAVLAYRAIAIWLPAPAGAHALVGLRRTVSRWKETVGARPAIHTVTSGGPLGTPGHG